MTDSNRQQVAQARWRAWLKRAGVYFFPPIYLFFVAHVLFSDKSIPIWDAEQQQMPYYSLLADSTRSFTPILWNPYSSGGAPDYAITDYFLLSPTVGIVALFFGSGVHGYQMYWFLMWVFGAWGIVALGRHLKAPDWGICVVNAGFLFSGFYCGQAQNPSSLSALSFLPWVVWRLDVALQERRARPALEAGAIFGVSALCSYFGLTALSGCYCGMWVMGRTLFAEEDSGLNESPKKRWIAGAKALVLMGVVGIVIMSPSLAGMLVEIKGYSDRASALPREVVISENVIYPGSLFSFASPYVSMIKRYHNNFWPDANLCLISVYAGVAATVLACASLFAKRSAWRRWLFAVALLCLVSTLGYHTPVRGWLYDFFFPTRYFRHPALFRMYWIFTLAVLALYATRDCAERSDVDDATVQRLAFKAACALGVVGVVWMTAFKMVAVGGGALAPLSGLADIHLFGIWGAMAGLCGLGWRSTPKFRQRVFPVLMVALACLDGLISFELNRPIMCIERQGDLQFWKAIEAKHRTSINPGAEGFARTARSDAFVPSSYAGMLHNWNLVSKDLVFRNYSPLTNGFHVAFSETHVLLQSALGFERVWFAANVPEIAPTKANFEAYKARAIAIGAAPVVAHSRDAILKPNAKDEGFLASEIAALQAPVNVVPTILEYTTNRLTFKIVAPGNGWLLITERWARGWNATVNGQPTEVRPGNFIFRCVPVVQGENRIDFNYRPFGFPELFYASAGMMLAMGLVTLVGTIRRLRK